jgi:hypothetical protein
MKTRVFAICMVLFLICGVAQADLKDGLVAYYPFNGNANDESGYGNNGTVYGATLTTDRFGKLNSAYLLSGNSGYYGSGIRIEIPCMIKNFTSISISLWARIDTASTTGEALIWFGSHGDGYVGIATDTLSSPKVIIYDNNTMQGWDTTNKGGYALISNPVGYFRHYAMVIDGSNGIVRGYYDGVKVVEYSVSPGAVNIFGNTCAVGKHWWDVARQSSTRINGVFDDIRIYGRALSAPEIQQLYQGQGTCSKEVVTFTAGTSAKAAEVNANFDALNCQIQALKTIVCQDHPTADVCK